jgi:hypothetical protein
MDKLKLLGIQRGFNQRLLQTEFQTWLYGDFLTLSMDIIFMTLVTYL